MPKKEVSEWARMVAALEIEKQPDRGAAILACAILDDTLMLSIKSRIYAGDSKLCNEFLNEQCSTLKSRTIYARSLGLINDKIKVDLLTIGQIRNKFAHRVTLDHDELTFDTPDISRLCNQLQSPNLDIAVLRKKQHPNTPRKLFLDATQQINAWLVDEIKYGKCEIKPYRWR